jgi:hypothetical protein
MCEVLGVPIKSEKTEGPATSLVFLGIELDTCLMEARLPQDKIEKIKIALKSVQKCKKIKLRDLQSLIGLLNFACYVVVPGRAFLRRLITLTIGVRKPHFKIRLNKQARLDLKAWTQFIDKFNGRCFFLDDAWQDSEKLHMFTDAAGSLGYGAVFGSKWFYGKWVDLNLQEFNITFKELFPIVVAIELWGHSLCNRSVLFFSDNLAVVHIINKTSSKDPAVMGLVRRLVLACLEYNILFRAHYIVGSQNVLPDLLSRLQVTKFREMAPYMDSTPTSVPPKCLHI